MTQLDLNNQGQEVTPRYYPRNLAFAKPAGQDVVEFFIAGKDEVGALGSVLQIISRHNINLLSIYAYQDTGTTSGEASPFSFVITFFADFSKSVTSVEALEGEIKKSLSFVEEVSWVKMSQMIYDHFLFPLTVLDNRVVALRADPLMDIEKKLIEKLGSAGASLMFQQGVDYARETTEQQISTFPDVPPDALLERNLEGFRVAGWGIFHCKRVANAYEISATNLPFHRDETGQRPESYFLNGIIVGMIQEVYGKHFKVASSEYDASTDKLLITIREE